MLRQKSILLVTKYLQFKKVLNFVCYIAGGPVRSEGLKGERKKTQAHSLLQN